MPFAPQRPCVHVGCSKLVKGRARYCAEHAQAEADRRASGSTDSRTEGGYTREWAAASKAFLSANPLCRRCLDRGVVVAATVTDHVTPHKKNPHLFWDSANWQSLCKPCHETKTARIDGGAVLKPEWLKPPGGTVVLVCGPPASGKSTYVRERANRQDAIIDLDEIVAELSGVAAGAVAARVWWTRAIRERNRRLANLYGRPAGVSAWIVITGTAIDRKWWVEKLKPTEVVILAVPEHVCAARISGDPARVGVAAKQISAARRWWSLERAAEENRLSR